METEVEVMLEKKGLVKLVEECGELIQIASKKMTRMDSDAHWDGNGSLQSRLEEEIANVLAIIEVVKENFALDSARIRTRKWKKVVLFTEWMIKDDAEVAVS
jgi:NTP pyrophosphatase (non-canonical NTP hydrolase)